MLLQSEIITLKGLLKAAIYAENDNYARDSDYDKKNQKTLDHAIHRMIDFSLKDINRVMNKNISLYDRVCEHMEDGVEFFLYHKRNHSLYLQSAFPVCINGYGADIYVSKFIKSNLCKYMTRWKTLDLDQRKDAVVKNNMPVFIKFEKNFHTIRTGGGLSFKSLHDGYDYLDAVQGNYSEAQALNSLLKDVGIFGEE